MTAGYQTLTEKEKATLRLLVNGHDAKSIACSMGLSIHTVNERLRDARRKMSVSSSREAARLAREAERGDPKSVVDEQLGDASTPVNGRDQAPLTAGALIHRPTVWIAGVIAIISLALAIFALSPAAQIDAHAANSGAHSAAAESDATQSARRWLSLVDASDWQSSWQTTGESFRQLNTVELWTSVSEKVRTPLGGVVSRKLILEEDVPTPPSGNIVVKFQTGFAGKPQATETIALSREADAWKVVGYYIE
jgi:DNA-binding CsgD family transcriptional regulator